MHKKPLKIIFALLIATSYSASADTSKTVIEKIRCEPTIAYQCTLKSCNKIDIITVYTSQHIEVDLKKNTIIGSIGDTAIDIEYFNQDKNNERAYVFYGNHTDSAATHDWLFRIDKNNGKMTITSVNDENSSTVFGDCRW